MIVIKTPVNNVMSFNSMNDAFSALHEEDAVYNLLDQWFSEYKADFPEKVTDEDFSIFSRDFFQCALEQSGYQLTVINQVAKIA